MQDLHSGAHLHCPADYHRLLQWRFGDLSPVLYLDGLGFLDAGLDAGLHALDGPVEVQLAELLFPAVHAVQPGEDLEPVGNKALHVGLLPDIDPAEPDDALVLLHRLLPELGEEVAVLAGAVVHLHDPDVVGVAQQVLVVLCVEGERGRGDLVDVAAVLVVVLPFLGIAEHFPGLHDLLKLLLAGVAVGVLVGMVLEH